MNAEQNWKQMNEQNDEDLSALLNISAIAKEQSNSPLQKIRTSFFYNMLWTILFSCLYLILFFVIDFWQIKAALAFLIVVHILGALSAYKQYKNINPVIMADQSVLEELKRQHRTVKNWMNAHLRSGLLFYPVSIGGSFLLGGAIGSSKSVEDFVSRPYMLLTTIILIIVLTPFCHFLAKKMLNSSFGKHLNDLQKNITDLESEEF